LKPLANPPMTTHEKDHQKKMEAHKRQADVAFWLAIAAIATWCGFMISELLHSFDKL